MIFARVGGSGPPLLLLHGYPQTHLMWHAAAPRLAERFTVVAADLAGYGASFRPAPAPDHAPHSKRALAADQVQAMAALGHERFAVAGHDRGGRVAYRMALDHPDRVSAAAVLDVVPTGEVWARADARLALAYWHWAFLAQPAPLPERLIAGDPDAFFDLHVRALGLGGAPDRYPARPHGRLPRPARRPEHRARRSARTTAPAPASTATTTTPTSARRRIECPLLALWSARGALPRLYGDVLEVWRPWAREVTGRGLRREPLPRRGPPEEVADALDDLPRNARTTHDQP